MLRLAIDENVNNDIVRALRRQRPGLDLIRVQDVGLAGVSDVLVLEWAGREGRVLLTHDVSTITRYAYDRVAAGLPMPGVFAVGYGTPLGRIIEDILLLVDCSLDDEWDGQIRYLPL